MKHFLYQSRQQQKNVGFTLIELLVCVLILGILASVAVSQYQKAVEKSRASKLLPLIHTLKTAQENYYMANGHYAESFEELDLSFPWQNTTKKHHFDGIKTVSLFNGTDLSVYIGYPPYRSCVFAMIAKGKFYPNYGYGQGVGYCFEKNGQWFPSQTIFCLEGQGEEGSFCREVMGFNSFYGKTWHRYFIR